MTGSEIETPERKDPARYHHGSLRDALVLAARGLIEREGMSGLSMRAVAREAGVTAAASYHHVPNKEGLIAAVVADAFQRAHAQAEEALARHDDPWLRLSALGRSYIRFALAEPNVFRLMFNPLVEHDAHPDVQACGEAYYSLLVGLLTSCVATGQTRHDDPHLLAVSAWASVHGMAELLANGAMGRPSEAEVSREAAIEEVLALVSHGMRRPGTSAR